jgi:hypothetical protein
MWLCVRRIRGHGKLHQACSSSEFSVDPKRTDHHNRSQYFHEIGQPQRNNFIARHLSFHGNTVATLSLGLHPARRAPYAAIMDDHHFHHVSPAYSRRFQKANESEEQYVERLRSELEDKFIQLGPDTVIGCSSSPACVRIVLTCNNSRRRNCWWSYNGMSPSSQRLFQSHEIGVRQVWSSVHP